MKYLFLVLILLLPAQLGKHFWPSWSLVDGVRVDYLAPTIYLTDILVLLIALCILFQKTQKTLMTRYPQKFRKPESQKFRLSDLLSFRFSGFPSIPSVLIIFFLLVGCWIYIADRRWLAVYWLARYLEIPLVAFLILKIRRIRGERRIRREIITALAIAVLWSAGLGIAQMILGRTTGWFWWLGERSFNLATPGAAMMTIFGREILRPYAAFGHPNALGGFLAAVIIFLKVQPWRTPRLDLLTTIGVIGVALTGSRGAMAGIIIAILLNCYIVKRLKRMMVLGALGILGTLGILGLFIAPYQSYFGSWSTPAPEQSSVRGRLSTQPKSDGTGFGRTYGFLQGKNPGPSEGISERLILMGAAVKMWKENWVIGVGAGQFLVELPKYLPAGFYKIQPVHNIFLLVPAEFGVVGAGMGLISLMSLMRQMSKTQSLKIWLPLLTVIFVTGMVDHYWLTAQQNRLLLGVILGLVLAPRSISDRGLRLRNKK